MKKLSSLVIISIMVFTPVSLVRAETMEFGLVWESPKQSQLPIAIMTTADLNGNGIKELLFTDFSRSNYMAAEVDEDLRDLMENVKSKIMIWEWQGRGMKLNWEKKFSPTTNTNRRAKYFRLVNYVKEMNPWNIKGKNIIEADPPFFQVLWTEGSYRWLEQYVDGQTKKNERMESWAFLFQKEACYPRAFDTGPRSYPRECIVGVRNFDSKKGLRIITLVKTKARLRARTLRVRTLEKGFPVEWEGNYQEGLGGSLGRYNESINHLILGTGGKFNRVLFYPNPKGSGYALKPIKGDRKIWEYGLKVKAGRTKNINLWEYWGYIWAKNNDGTSTHKLRKAYLGKGKTEMILENISFPTHKNFLRVGSFALADLDNDGLDDVVLIEETGKTEGSGEHGYKYSDVAQYVRVLKWNGKKYEVAWTSPPIKSRRNRVLVDDVMGNGKKQIVVGTGYGTIQVWEKK